MKVTVFVPTYRMGGLDVLEASLARQTYQDFNVLVSDELFWKRAHVWNDIDERLDGKITPIHVPRRGGHQRNLCAGYNLAARKCVESDVDLMISLQDYIWLPPDGIEKFVYVAERSPDDLITGLTSISKGPGRVTGAGIASDPNFYYSIFVPPYYDKPEEIDWLDCRIDGVYEYFPEDVCLQILPQHWEANWAAIPVNYFRAGCFWDEEYDKGIAYENMDFARNAIEKTGRRVIMDTTNHAISLPHKDYFKGEREDIITYSNRQRYEERWGA